MKESLILKLLINIIDGSLAPIDSLFSALSLGAISRGVSTALLADSFLVCR
jgi:hypothetical protein